MKVNKIGSSRVFSAAVSGSYPDKIIIKLKESTSSFLFDLKTSGIVSIVYELNGVRLVDKLQKDYSGSVAVVSDPGSLIIVKGKVLEYIETQSTPDVVDFSHCRSIEVINTEAHSKQEYEKQEDYETLVIRNNVNLRTLSITKFSNATIDLSASTKLHTAYFGKEGDLKSFNNTFSGNINIPESIVILSFVYTNFNATELSIQLPNIKQITVVYCEIDGTPTLNFNKNASIEYLYLWRNSIFEEIDLTDAVSLRSVRLENETFVGDAPTNIVLKNNIRLEEFRATTMLLTGSFDLETSTGLKVLEVFRYNFDYLALPHDLFELSELRFGDGASTVKRLASIQSVMPNVAYVSFRGVKNTDTERGFLDFSGNTRLTHARFNATSNIARSIDFSGCINADVSFYDYTLLPDEVRLNGSKVALQNDIAMNFARDITQAPSTGGTIYVNAGETALTTGEAATLLTNKGWTVVEE